jgi:hypothetical protein
MPRRKHTKKQAVVACTDANQRVRESLRERARIAEAKQKKFEMLREQYMEEMKRREEAANNDKKPMIISPTITPATDRDIANE